MQLCLNILLPNDWLNGPNRVAEEGVGSPQQPDWDRLSFIPAELLQNQCWSSG